MTQPAVRSRLPPVPWALVPFVALVGAPVALALATAAVLSVRDIGGHLSCRTDIPLRPR